MKDGIMKTESEWVRSQTPQLRRRYEMCQCGSERVIRRSSDSARMRAALISLVFFDQFIYTHYPFHHDEFKEQFEIPKLRGHSFGGHASPAWFVYPSWGHDKEADWDQISKTFNSCANELNQWLDDYNDGRFQTLILEEVSIEFPEDQQQYFNLAAPQIYD